MWFSAEVEINKMDYIENYIENNNYYIENYIENNNYERKLENSCVILTFLLRS